ncbi:MAG: hybrid sensor histidine kinase/response regulator [Burkholderiales bacterium]|nr:hybrid sensor histidine kinase/response regulator [Burkholderiales bacterium]
MAVKAAAGAAWRRGWLALGLAAWLLLAGAAEPLRVVTTAEWQDAAGRWQPVSLPDGGNGVPGRAAERRYRWTLAFDAPAQGRALYFPGMQAQARLVLNGQLLHDSLSAGVELPRAPDWPLLVAVPDALWRTGANEIELLARGAPFIEISRLEVGPLRELQARQRAKLGGTVVGPLVSGAVIGVLGIVMLALWVRRHEVIVGSFGLAALGWGLHNAWSAWPTLLLPQPHQMIWWHVLLGFWISMVVIFCLRYADWVLPHVERALWALAPASVPLLYAGAAANRLVTTTHWWRLGLIVVVAGGVVAMLSAIWRRRDLDAWLIGGSAVVSLGLGIHDWRGDPTDNNFVRLVPYTGLVFVFVVVRLLVDRFIATQRSLEGLNAELEQRVAAQNAELRRALDEMSHARDAAEAAGQAKARFLAAASHDLRQPAHALGLYLAALRQQPLAGEPAELAERMARSLAALDSLFNSLLDVSRIDAGAVVPRPAPTALAPLLQRLADEAAPQAEARGLRLALRLGRGAEAALVRTDALLLERILRNLLGNALRYTVHGGVLLALRRRGPAWRIEVWDTGIGIAAEHRERVFEEFFQVGNAERDRNSGLGLGLAIVQRLATLLGLPLALHSRPGHGTVFGLALPALQAPPPFATPAAPAAAAVPLVGLRIGVLEDDADVRDALTRLLRGWGCEVQAAGLAEAGFAAGTQALVVDQRLPGGRSGIEAVQRLRATLGAALPALVVTGESDPAVLRELAAAGLPTLAKPVPAERLREWLEGVVAGRAR